jgi:hypothetical protein
VRGYFAHLRFSQLWLWSLPCSSSGTWCHVVREKFADVSKGYTTSIYRVEYVLNKELGRTKQHIESVTNNNKPYVFSFFLHIFMHLYVYICICVCICFLFLFLKEKIFIIISYFKVQND